MHTASKVPDTENGVHRTFILQYSKLLVKTAQITKKGSDQLAGEILHLDKHLSPALGRTLFNTPLWHTLGVPSGCSIHL